MSGANGREPVEKVPHYVEEIIRQVRRCKTCGAPFPRTLERCPACGDEEAIDPTLPGTKPSSNENPDGGAQ